MARMPNAKEVMARVWALKNGLEVPLPETEDDWEEPGETIQDTIMPGHVGTKGESSDSNDTVEESLDDINNPVSSYINELILDLVTKNHTKLANLGVIRAVFRAVLLKLCDAEPHTFADIRSSITQSRRHYVKQVLTRLQSHNLVVEVELNNRLFYRAHLDEVAKIRAYIVATESIR